MMNRHQDDDSDIVVTPVGVLNYHRLYERYLFFYVLILSVCLFFGMWLFSRRIDGLSAAETLAWHFVNYIFVVGLMALTPVWYTLFLQWLPETDRIWREIRRALNSIPDEEERIQVARVLYVNGEWPPSILQTAALVVIFAILLWEILFIFCWVDADGALVWQPDWVKAVAQWVGEHAGNRHQNGKFFIFILDQEKINRMTALGYPQIKDANFFNLPFGHSVLFFHAWRAVSYPIVLLCSGVVLWRSLDWLGMERMNPRNIHGAGRFIWCSIISPFMLAFLFCISLPMLGVSFFTLFSIVPELWVSHLKFYICCAVFSLLALKFFWGWLQFWKRVFRF